MTETRPCKRVHFARSKSSSLTNSNYFFFPSSMEYIYRAATGNFWQAKLPKWRPPQWCVAAAFYSAKSRQGLGLGGLASHGGPDIHITYLQQ